MLFATSLRSPFRRTPKAPESSSPPGVFTDILLLSRIVLATIVLSEEPELTKTPATFRVTRLPSMRLKVAPEASLMPPQAQLST